MASIHEEIARLETLMSRVQEEYNVKYIPLKIVVDCAYWDTSKIEKQIEERTKQVEKEKTYMELKISFYKQYLTKKMRPTMLEELDIAMTEWLGVSCNYFRHKQTDYAEKEYQKLKVMFDACN